MPAWTRCSACTIMSQYRGSGQALDSIAGGFSNQPRANFLKPEQSGEFENPKGECRSMRARSSVVSCPNEIRLTL
jgi:hypothetical protein